MILQTYFVIFGFRPEYHHVGGRLGEGGDEAGETDQHHEGEKEVGTSAATGPRRGVPETADTPTLCVVLHRQTHTVWSLQNVNK